ncbi:hypothetical protein LR48_Vigan06g093300 [Vigna angularis]|uniref:Uncharacterized protein n=1 Tax=Phaseolus angularis TaxID=3914 RepID=A0A0L9UST0_PHAAN|nr:hypothetical protein LR48_Vigan06g093300 [Vigna angularis]
MHPLFRVVGSRCWTCVASSLASSCTSIFARYNPCLKCVAVSIGARYVLSSRGPLASSLTCNAGWLLLYALDQLCVTPFIQAAGPRFPMGRVLFASSTLHRVHLPKKLPDM